MHRYVYVGILLRASIVQILVWPQVKFALLLWRGRCSNFQFFLALSGFLFFIHIDFKVEVQSLFLTLETAVRRKCHWKAHLAAVLELLIMSHDLRQSRFCHESVEQKKQPTFTFLKHIAYIILSKCKTWGHPLPFPFSSCSWEGFDGITWLWYGRTSCQNWLERCSWMLIWELTT